MLLCPYCGLSGSEEELEWEFQEDFDGIHCPDCDTELVDTQQEQSRFAYDRSYVLVRDKDMPEEYTA